MPVSPTGHLKENLDSFYVTDSPLSITDIAELASFTDYPLGDLPVSRIGQLKKSLEHLNVTDSPLCAANIAELAMF